MVYVFGVDMPLVELILAFSVITMIILVEVTVIMVILLYQLKHSRAVGKELEDARRKERK